MSYDYSSKLCYGVEVAFDKQGQFFDQFNLDPDKLCEEFELKWVSAGSCHDEEQQVIITVPSTLVEAGCWAEAIKIPQAPTPEEMQCLQSLCIKYDLAYEPSWFLIGEYT